MRLIASDNLEAAWLGTHASPSKWYPSKHGQWCDPTSLTQDWLLVQLLGSLPSHSSMSSIEKKKKKKKPFLCNLEEPQSKAITNYWNENETWNLSKKKKKKKRNLKRIAT